MSTLVTCTAVLCRHLANGVCSLRRILLGNAEFHYEKFCRINGVQRAYGDEQFCRSFAPARSPDASPSSAMTTTDAPIATAKDAPMTVATDKSTMDVTEKSTIIATEIPITLSTITDATDVHTNAGT